MLKTFGDRVRFVIGSEQWTPWAIRHGIAPSTVDGWLHKGVGPYKKTLAKLEEATGIPAEWWKNGEGPPPERLDQAVDTPIDALALPPGQRDALDRAASQALSRQRNGDAQSSINEYALRTAEEEQSQACQDAPAAYPLGARPKDGLVWGTNRASQSSVAMPLAMRLARAIETTDWLPASRSPKTSLLLMREALDLLFAASGNQLQRLEAIVNDPAALDGTLRLAWALMHAEQPTAPPQNGGNP